MKKLRVYWLIVCLMGIAGVGCNNDDDDSTIGRVIVRTVDDNAVPDATVILECESSINKECNILIQGISDENGVFEVERELSQILRVTSYKIVFDTNIEGIIPDTTLTITRDSICGESFLSFVEGETTSQTVVLYSCN